MSEADAIERTDEPVTVGRLVDDLRDLRVEAGDTLLVHASLSALGWVAGGPVAVVDALQEAVTADGTLVMPAHTGLSDPANWQNPPVPDDWIPVIRAEIPAYRPAVTPTRGLGAIPECFRNYPGVVRSRHPSLSFAAWGADADAIVADHSYDDALGDGSPLARVYDRDGDVLLLGVGHGPSTSLHLAEYRADYPKDRTTHGGPVLVDGEREWVEFEDIEISDDDFEEVGAAFEEECEVAVGPVGEGTARLFSQRDAADFAVEWFGENRA
jgi:aminoglycoside 3-N-acetyltransferase